MYKSEDCGLFIGLMTMPFGQEETFFEREVKSVFDQRRADIEKQLKSKKDIKAFEPFYLPKAYCLCGSFDMVVLSLIDDFHLATRSFHPFSPLSNRVSKADNYQAQNYTFKISTGVAPDLKYIEQSAPSLIEKAQNTFLNNKSPKDYPFIAITNLKINNALLIGTGGATIELLIREIYTYLKTIKLKGQKIDFIITHSFSWNELSIVFFANNYNIIKDCVLDLRKLRFSDLLKKCRPDTKEKLITKTLLHHALKNEAENKADELVKDTLVFLHSHTTFGYDPKIMLTSEQPLVTIDKNISFYTRWFIQPGYLDIFMQKIQEELPELATKAKFIIGRGDIAYTTKEEYFSTLKQLMDLIKEHKLGDYIRKLYTIPEFDIELDGNQNLAEMHHCSFHQKLLANYGFAPNEISNIEKNLKALRVSKAVRERIMNLFVVFNDGIDDPILYSYFIELKPFLINLKNDLPKYVSSKDEKLQSVKTITDLLDQLSKRFELGYSNRIGQSYIMNEITDFNLEFKGGIQQLLSAYDAAYKSLTNIFGEYGNNYSITYVTGDSSIESDIISISLNYFHLFQPSILLSVITHEAANFLLERNKRNSNISTIQDLISTLDKCADNDEYKHYHDVLNYYLVDIIPYRLIYNENFDLFFFWHWHHFIQIPLIYNTKGEVDADIFKETLLRIVLLAYTTGNKSYIKKQKAPFPKLDELWGEWFSSILVIAEWLLKEEMINNIIELSKKLSKSEASKEFIGLYDKQIPPKNIKLFEQFHFDRFIINEFDSFKKMDDFSKDENKHDYMIKKRKELMQQLSEEIITAFKNGESYDFNHSKLYKKYKKTCNSSFKFQALFHAYLQLIKSLMHNNNKNKNTILDRNAYGLAITEENHADILMDVHGGIITKTLKVRRSYFKYRALLITSLWNLSTQYKIRLFTDTNQQE